MFVSYESKSKREIIFWANLTKNSIDKAAYIRENSLYQKNKYKSIRKKSHKHKI